MEEMIAITKAEYDQLIEESIMLDCLKAAGVDNWDGYELAMEMFENSNNE